MVISRSVIVSLLILAAPLNNAIAEEFCSEDGSCFNCTEKDYQRSVANIAKAKKLEQAGNYRQAEETLADTSCLIFHEDETKYYKEIDAIEERLYKDFGDEAEKNGQFEEALKWYRRGDERHIKDEERVIMKMAKAKPDDLGTIKSAFDFFKVNGMADSLKTIRAMAVQNAKPWLVEEDKQFGSKQSEIYGKAFGSLEQAQKWLVFAEAPENRLAAERAEKRGDSIASQTRPYFLKETIKYYEFAGKAEKVKSVKDRAKKLGDEARGKGEGEVAAEYYQIAGLNDQARDLSERTKAKHREDEGKRQKQFKKDQDSLEKELGM